MFRLTPPSEPDRTRSPRACFPCAHAKAKCEFEVEESICNRCRRLKKPCAGQVPGAHRRKSRPASDVARLERKLDGVAAVLAASKRVGSSLLPNQLSISDSTVLSPSDHVGQILKDNEELLILNAFRKDLGQHFPFVVIPPHMTPDDLKDAKPFLFMTVMTVGCRHDVERQSALAQKVREVVSHRMIVGGEQSLDILQGLLIYLAWLQVHFHLGSQLCNLTHLAMSVVSDLGLNKNVQQRLMGTFGTLKYFRPPERQIPKRSLDERRAFLGCFYVSTMVSVNARDFEPIRYSSYADECCRTLEERAEYPCDKYLVNLVRIMYMGSKIARSFTQDEWDVSSGLSAPVGAYVRALDAEMQNLKAALPSGTLFADILWLHYFFVEILLYEVAVHDSIGSAGYSDFSMTRLKMLFTCLNSTKSFFEKWHALPTSAYFDFTYFQWSLMGHASVVLAKLCLFSGEGWDSNYARDTFDFCATVDTVMIKMNEAKTLAEHSAVQLPRDPNTLPWGVPQMFQDFTPRLQQWKELHKYKAAQILQGQQPQVLSSVVADDLPSVTAHDEFLFPGGSSLVDFLDDSFWPQLL
ncbi:hypothetical protein LTS15_007746 [Exophiala xenobiotica]|nr:hypothetical protein LTS15_007746 [Exophiala xenobiotica]